MTNTTLHGHVHLGDTMPPVSAPVVAYVVSIMVCGVLGNGLVLLVYGRKIQKLSNYRSFVLMLAGIDMAQSCIGMPGILVDMLNAVTFYSNTGCKLLRLMSHLILSASLMTHLLIGIERHRKICKPLKRQISTRAAKMILMAVVLLSFVIALPSYMFYGKCKIEVREANVTLHVCFITEDYATSPLPTIYEILISIFLVSTVLILFLIYVQIARRIWKTKKAIQPFLKRFSNVVHINERSSRILESINEKFSEAKQSIYRRIGTVFHRRSRILPSKASTSTNGRTEETNRSEKSKTEKMEYHKTGKGDTNIGIQMITGQKPNLRTLPSQTDAETDISDVFHSRNSDQNDSTTAYTMRTQLNSLSRIKTVSSKPVKKHSRKVTAVSFAITFVFIISYVPHFAILIFANVNAQRKIHLSSIGEVLFRIGYLSYILNNAANSIVYYIMDNDFKEKCNQLIRWRCRKTK